MTNVDYKLTIIVPVFNEEDNIDRIETEFLRYVSRAKFTSRLLFVDDGSTDTSLKKIKALCARHEAIECIQLKSNTGLSAGIRAGINYCQTDLIAYIDADLQTDIRDLDVLAEDIEKFDAVIGYRARREDTINKRIQSLIANAFRRSIINDGIIDTGCPLKLMKKDVAQKLLFFDGMHRFIPALIQIQGGKIKQVPVRHYKRLAGQSKFNIFNRSIKPFQDALALRWMKKRAINYEVEAYYSNKN